MSAIFLENKQMTAGFDPETGKLISIRMKGDPLKTEYIGNRKNISCSQIYPISSDCFNIRCIYQITFMYPPYIRYCNLFF